MENLVQIFLRSLRTGTVTAKYPAAPDPPPPGFRGRPVVDTARCAGTAHCVAVCPSGAITLTAAPGGWRWQLDVARCVFCGLCAEACPAEAITMSREFELAVRDRRDLVTVVQYQAAAPEVDA
jgi:hydrogenase-4 component H